MGLKIYLGLILAGLTLSSGDSYKDQNRYPYYYAFAAPGLEFQDIYPPGGTHITFPEEPSSTSPYDDLLLSSTSTKLDNTHPQTVVIQPVPSTPITVLNSSHVKIPRTSTTIKQLKDMPINEIPMEEMQKKTVPKRYFQRGLLDVLLPASRVRAFRNAFNTLKRMLSHTFKKR